MAHDSKHGKISPADCKSRAVKVDVDAPPKSYLSEEQYAKMKYGSKEGQHKGSLKQTKYDK